MDERSGRNNGLIVLALIALAIVGAVFCFQRFGATEAAATAIDESVDFFVPSEQHFERRMQSIDEAQRLTDTINARQARGLPTDN